MELDLTINGRPKTYDVNRADSLLDVLRDNGYTGAKRGCDTGDCGYCTVIVDDEPVQSCVTPAKNVEGASVETIESLGEQDALNPVQEAFVDNTALQCGFCIPGMIMNATAALRENPDPTEPEARKAIEPVLCRCTGHKKPVEAVLDAADRIDSAEDLAPGGGLSDDDASATEGGSQ